MRRLILFIFAGIFVSCSIAKELEPDVAFMSEHSEKSPTVYSIKTLSYTSLIRSRMQSDPECIMLRSLIIVDGKIRTTLSLEEALKLGVPEHVYKMFTNNNL